MNIEEMYREEIAREFEKLKEKEVGSEEHLKISDNISKLTDRLVEMDKVSRESYDKIESRMMDNALRTSQMKNERIIHWVKIGGEVVIVTMSLAGAIWGTVVSINFEKEGTMTTQAGRGWLSRILRTR